jgi:hypothetical protein
MTKTWTIHNAEWNPKTGFISHVHWRFAISEEDKKQNKTYYADSYSVATFTQDEEATTEDFIPFEKITNKEMIINWVKDYLGEDKIKEMEESLIAKIEEQKNPPIVSGLPWEVNNELTTNTNNNE